MNNYSVIAGTAIFWLTFLMLSNDPVSGAYVLNNSTNTLLPNNSSIDLRNINARTYLLFGSVSWSDRQLLDETIYKPAFWWAARAATVKYPKYSLFGDTITAIQIYGEGFAYILSGGVGYRSAWIRLYSGGVNRGLNLRVEIYGH